MVKTYSGNSVTNHSNGRRINIDDEKKEEETLTLLMEINILCVLSISFYCNRTPRTPTLPLLFANDVMFIEGRK